MPSSSRNPGTCRPPCQPSVYWPREVCRSRSSGRVSAERTFSSTGRRWRGRTAAPPSPSARSCSRRLLDDVARGADAVVVAGAAADADVLGHRDLHVVDVVAVPDRLEHRVGEAQGQQVLDRLLAEVVVDPAPDGKTSPMVALRSRALCRSWPNGFSMTTRRHAPSLETDRSGALELLHDVAEELRRDRQVECVALGSAHPVDVEDHLRQLVERLRVGEVAGDEADPLAQLQPDTLLVRGAGVLAHRVSWTICVKSGRPSRDVRSRRGRTPGQQPAVGEVVDRGSVARGEVAGDAEDHQAARPRDAG